MSKRKATEFKGDKRATKKTKGVTQHQEKLLKQLATREIKYAQFTFAETAILPAATTATAIDNTFNLNPAEGTLSFVVQGDNINQRTGRKIAINSIRIHATLKWQQQDGAAIDVAYNPAVRLVLAIDQNANGAVANVSADTRLFTPNGYWSFISNNAFGKYRVLQDKTYWMENMMYAPNGTNFITSGGIKPIKLKHKFKDPLIVNYNNNVADDIRQVIDNNIFLMGMSDRAVADCFITYVARIAYTDL